MEKIALIGDIVSSRKIVDRGAFQLKLEKLFAELNRRKQGIDSPYTITIGDEFQALFNSAHGMLRDAVKILSAIYPTKVRVSFGIGSISTQINRKQALGMDGPAFYRARDGIDMRRQKEQRKKTASFISITGSEKRMQSNTLITASLPLFCHLLNKLNKTALDTLVMSYDGIAVNKIAANMGLTVQAVYKAIRIHAIEDMLNYIRAYENNIQTMLEEK